MVGDNRHPEASLFDQPDLERLLLDAVETAPAATLRRGCTVTELTGSPAGATVTYIDGGAARGRIEAAAVLGCDGAGSTVRSLLGAEMRDLRFDEDWLVLDMRSDRPLDVRDGVSQVCDPARAATVLRVGADRYRWEFRLAPGESADELTASPRLAELLRPWTGSIEAGALEMLRRAAYTFRARIARTWRSGRVFLLGDAAHEMPPFIGQGLGAGLRDAHNLAWKLDLVVRGAAPERLLDTYQAERLPHATRTIRLSIAAGWALTGGQDRAARVRRVVVDAGCRVPGVSAALLRVAGPPLSPSGPPRVPLVARRGSGRLCPQPAGGPGRWLDEALGPSFGLVTAESLDRATAAAAADLGVAVVPVGMGGPYGPVAEWLARLRREAALVRPDRVVLATGRTPADLVPVIRGLGELLPPTAVAAR